MICQCCQENKPSSAFSHSGKRGYADKCKECGVWLRLFAAAFGPSRKWHENRKITTELKRVLKAQQPPKEKKPVEKKVKPPKPLPIKERETYVYAYRTVLAVAPWPYRSANCVSGVPA